MSVKIRLARFGKKGYPVYRIVVIDKKNKREGKFIDQIGYYNPNVNPPEIKYLREKLNDWIKKGAQPSEGIKKIFKHLS